MSRSTPNGHLSRAMNSRTCVCLSEGDRVEGGNRDTVSMIDVVAHLPNSHPRGMMNCAACIRGTRSMVLISLDNDRNPPRMEDWSLSIFCTGIVFVTLSMGCQLRRKSSQGWMRYRESSWEISSLVWISTIPSIFVHAQKTCADSSWETTIHPSLKARHGSFIQQPETERMGSSFTLSYNSVSKVRSCKCWILEVIVPISMSGMADRICEVKSQLKIVILDRRQLLKLPDLPVHARMLTSPQLVSSCAKSQPSALSPSPYVQ